MKNKQKKASDKASKELHSFVRSSLKQFKDSSDNMNNYTIEKLSRQEYLQNEKLVITSGVADGDNIFKFRIKLEVYVK